MPQQGYLSTDPNWGAPMPKIEPLPAHEQAPRYVSSDPNWGAAPARAATSGSPLSPSDPTLLGDFNPAGGPGLQWAKRHPGTAGALIGGALAIPTGGASLMGGGLGGAMIAEATGAGLGTIAGNAVTGHPQDPRETLVNATLGAGGPVLGRTVGGAIRLARQTPSAALDVAEHLPYVGGVIRLARLPGKLSELADVIAPAAEAPVDAAGRALGGYAGPERRAATAVTHTGPERRLLPKDDVLEAIRTNPNAVREADAARQRFANYKAEAHGPASTPAPAEPPPTPRKYLERDARRAASPAEPAPSPEPPPRWQPNPEDVEAERAFKRGLNEQDAKALAARVRPTTPRVPAIGPANYFLRKPGSEPSFMGFGNPAPEVDALARELAETLGMTTEDALTLIEQQPELKSVTKDAMRRAVSGKGRR